MSAAEYLTWDGDPGNGIAPRRPGTDDMGGDELVDDLAYPPEDGEMPTATSWNQIVKQVAAIGKVTGVCKLAIHFTGGAPVVAMVTAPGSGITGATFTLSHPGAGRVQVTWPAGTFPAPTCWPTGLTVFSPDEAPGGARWGQVNIITNGFLVSTFLGTTLTDIDWAIEIN